MKKLMVNTKIIKQFNPCQQGIGNWKTHYKQQTYDFLTFLNLPNILARDKVWLAVRLLPRELVEVFAIDCALEATQYSESYAYATAAAAAADAAAASAAAASAAANSFYAGGAADAAAAAADAAAAANAERERQLDCLAYLYGEYYNNAAVD